MNVSKYALLALCIALSCAPGGASAQESKWDKQWDLKPLVPPVIRLPPNSRLDSGTGGGMQTPSTPQQSRGQPSSQPAPGFRLSIPNKQDGSP